MIIYNCSLREKKNLMLLLQDSKNQRKNVAYTLEAEKINAFNLVFNVKTLGGRVINDKARLKLMH